MSAKVTCTKNSKTMNKRLNALTWATPIPSLSSHAHQYTITCSDRLHSNKISQWQQFKVVTKTRRTTKILLASKYRLYCSALLNCCQLCDNDKRNRVKEKLIGHLVKWNRWLYYSRVGQKMAGTTKKCQRRPANGRQQHTSSWPDLNTVSQT